jgi:hypothetical protein
MIAFVRIVAVATTPSHLDRAAAAARAIANDQSAMSRAAGGFLGESFAGGGAASEAAPELVGAAEPDPSDVLRGVLFVVALRRAASAGRDRGMGGVFRSTFGIGIGGTNLSSICATAIAGAVKKPGAGRAIGGMACAWLSVAAGASRQRQNLMAGNIFTLTISAPARDQMSACVPTQFSQSMGR